MKSLIVCLSVVSALCLLPSAYCAACPLVAVPSVSAVATVGVPALSLSNVQSVALAAPQIAVQTFAVPQIVQQPAAIQTFALPPLAVQSFGVQAVAVPVVPQAGCAQRVQRAGILGRVLGGRRLLPSARSVSVVR